MRRGRPCRPLSTNDGDYRVYDCRRAGPPYSKRNRHRLDESRWDSAIDEARQFQDAEFLYEDIEKEHGADVAKAAIEKHWRAKQLLLNNAFSLLQQSLEIALKAKIAEVSPFLLIAGDPRTWPKAKDGTNVIDFSNFRTIDAVQLCGAVNTVSATPLSKELQSFMIA